MEQLRGKVALVTGGSSGIGRAAALAFARAGAQVILAARGVDRGNEVQREIRALGGVATFVSADVSRSDQVHALIERTVAEYGRLDCAFNNAASVEEPFTMTADFSEDQFDRSIALNLKSVWLCMKHEIRHPRPSPTSKPSPAASPAHQSIGPVKTPPVPVVVSALD
jgi:NAD(P)-dependent dehydrogenase (short-subunit alcohol dehydrogenase family)